MEEHKSQMDMHSSRMDKHSSRMEKHTSRMEELTSHIGKHTTDKEEHSLPIEELYSPLKKHSSCMEEQSLLAEELSSKTQLEVSAHKYMHLVPLLHIYTPKAGWTIHMVHMNRCGLTGLNPGSTPVIDHSHSHAPYTGAIFVLVVTSASEQFCSGWQAAEMCSTQLFIIALFYHQTISVLTVELSSVVFIHLLSRCTITKTLFK